MSAGTGDRDRWVLVTGGSRGIGRGVVEAFAAARFDVVFIYHHSHDAARTLEHHVGLTGGRATGYPCDCTDEAAVRVLAEELLVQRGAPHAVINNAGITQDGNFMAMTSAQWRDVLEANLHSAFLVTRYFVNAMIDRGDGVVLQMSSVTAMKGNAGQTNYAASKAAMVGMTKSLALELARFNVRVNAVVPGLIATEMVAQIPEAKQAAFKRSIPLRRFGTVHEVAALCLFLASDDGAYLTGQTFVIDGGLSA